MRTPRSSPGTGATPGPGQKASCWDSVSGEYVEVATVSCLDNNDRDDNDPTPMPITGPSFESTLATTCIQLFVQMDGCATRVMSVERGSTVRQVLELSCQLFGTQSADCYFVCGMKQLAIRHSLLTYNIGENAMLYLHSRLRGGSPGSRPVRKCRARHTKPCSFCESKENVQPHPFVGGLGVKLCGMHCKIVEEAAKDGSSCNCCGSDLLGNDRFVCQAVNCKTPFLCKPGCYTLVGESRWADFCLNCGSKNKTESFGSHHGIRRTVAATDDAYETPKDEDSETEPDEEEMETEVEGEDDGETESEQQESVVWGLRAKDPDALGPYAKGKRKIRARDSYKSGSKEDRARLPEAARNWKRPPRVEEYYDALRPLVENGTITEEEWKPADDSDAVAGKQFPHHVRIDGETFAQFSQPSTLTT